MIIGIDARVLEEGNGGTFVYANNIISQMVSLAPEHEFRLFVNRSYGTRRPHIAQLSAHPQVRVYRYRFPNKFLNASFRFFHWPEIDRLLKGCDVLFFPTMLYGAWSADARTVLTMHDLSFEFFTRFFTAKQNLWHHLVQPREWCQNVDRLIAVSRHTKGDLMSVYGIADEKITVVHSGVTSEFRVINNQARHTGIKKKYRLPDKQFILQFGTLEPRKNAIASLRAFERVCADSPELSAPYDIIFAGHAGWKSGTLLRAISRSRVRARIHVRTDIMPEDVPLLYNISSMFLYPSFYEGFGLPVLEAFACGTPVITSHTSSLGELAQDAALLVDPYRIDDIMTALRALMGERALSVRLHMKGIARSSVFTWEQAAKKTLAVLTH